MAALPDTKSPVVAAIEAMWAAKPDGERAYLGASELGRPCERRLWYAFRWAGEPEAFSGRMRRLFATGEMQEHRLLDDLEDIGCHVERKNPSTDDQWGIVFAGGHGGGHLDAEASGIPGGGAKVHVVECKTHNAKSFAELVKHGVQVAKPQHFAQMQTYMHFRKRDRALYLAVNKDTEDLYAERVHYDAVAALQLEAKAERIVAADSPPARLSNNPDFYECRSCPARPVCHEGLFARRNCRTCARSTPVEGGEWHCDAYDKLLTLEEQRAGCRSHLYIPGLVPGEQVDFDADRGTVSYVLAADGKEWVDGAAAEAAP